MTTTQEKRQGAPHTPPSQQPHSRPPQAPAKCTTHTNGTRADLTAFIDLEPARPVFTAFIEDLIPGGKFDATHYRPRCPWRDDRHPGSLRISIEEDTLGLWIDESTGERGDLAALVRLVRGYTTRAEAKAELHALDGLPQAERDRLRKRSAALATNRRPSDREPVRAGGDALSRGTLDYYQRVSCPIMADTPAGTYMADVRGIPGPYPSDLRAAVLTHAPPEVLEVQGRHGRYHAIVAFSRCPLGIHRGVQVTYLDDEGRRIVRRNRGPRAIRATQDQPAVGFHIRLSDRTPEEHGGHIVVAEGVETALSAALLLRDEGADPLPFSTMGTSGMYTFTPPVGVSRVTIAVDMDTAGEAASAALAERLESRFYEVERIYPPHPYGDFNDVIRGVA